MPYKNKEIGRIKKQEYYLRTKEAQDPGRKAYYQKNRSKIILNVKNYVIKNRKKIVQYRKEYHIKNQDKIKKYHHQYNRDNKEKILQYKQRTRPHMRQMMRLYRAKRIKTDPNYHLAINLRTRLGTAIKRNSKRGSAVGDLGCTIPELKIYLENRFQKGMTWDNWGRRGWHIDHIKPLKEFNLTDRKQFLKVVHYTNLQPLWWQDNLAKRFI